MSDETKEAFERAMEWVAMTEIELAPGIHRPEKEMVHARAIRAQAAEMEREIKRLKLQVKALSETIENDGRCYQKLERENEQSKSLAETYHRANQGFPPRIEELERENAHLKDLFKEAERYDAERGKRIAEMERENAELKECLKTQVRWTDEAIEREERLRGERNKAERERDELKRRIEGAEKVWAGYGLGENGPLLQIDKDEQWIRQRYDLPPEFVVRQVYAVPVEAEEPFDAEKAIAEAPDVPLTTEEKESIVQRVMAEERKEHSSEREMYLQFGDERIEVAACLGNQLTLRESTLLPADAAEFVIVIDGHETRRFGSVESLGDLRTVVFGAEERKEEVEG